MLFLSFLLLRKNPRNKLGVEYPVRIDGFRALRSPSQEKESPGRLRGGLLRNKKAVRLERRSQRSLTLKDHKQAGREIHQEDHQKECWQSIEKKGEGKPRQMLLLRQRPRTVSCLLQHYP